MINLLADDRKNDIRAARVNVILIRYITILFAAVVFLMGVLYVSYTVLQATKASADQIVESNDVKADVYKETKTKVDALSAKLRDGRALMANEIHYSKVLTSLGASMPEGAVLDSIEFSEASFTGVAVPVTAYAKTNEAAAQISERLQASPLVAQVKVQETDTSKGTADYPVSVTMTIVFNKAGAK